MNDSPFPSISPYNKRIANEPEFNPAAHLSLEMPENVLTLSELGYESPLMPVPTNIAATSCFRVLSEKGAAVLYHVCKQLGIFTTSNARIARNVRGGVYRSAFLRDLALSTDVAEHMSKILGTPLAPRGIKNRERITLVNGYSYKNSGTKDYSALGQLTHADPEPTVLARIHSPYGTEVQSTIARRYYHTRLSFKRNVSRIRFVISED